MQPFDPRQSWSSAHHPQGQQTYGQTPPTWAIGTAIGAVTCGAMVFVYLGMVGGRVAAEVVLPLLALTVGAALATVIGGAKAILKRRVSYGVATIALAGFGVLVAASGIALDVRRHESQRSNHPVHSARDSK